MLTSQGWQRKPSTAEAAPTSLSAQRMFQYRQTSPHAPTCVALFHLRRGSPHVMSSAWRTLGAHDQRVLSPPPPLPGLISEASTPSDRWDGMLYTSVVIHALFLDLETKKIYFFVLFPPNGSDQFILLSLYSIWINTHQSIILASNSIRGVIIIHKIHPYALPIAFYDRMSTSIPFFDNFVKHQCFHFFTQTEFFHLCGHHILPIWGYRI